MAKVIYPATVAGIVGRVTTGVYYRSASQKFGYLRSWTMPTITDNMTLHGSYMTNLRNIYMKDLDGAFVEDLKIYAAKYKDLPTYGEAYKVRASGAFAIWYKAVYVWSLAEGPTVNLDTVTIEDFGTFGTFGTSVAAIVANGWLPAVDGYELLTNGMV